MFVFQMSAMWTDLKRDSKSFLPLFGHSFKGPLEGRGRQEVQRAFYLWLVFQKAWEEVSSPRTCQAFQRLRGD